MAVGRVPFRPCGARGIFIMERKKAQGLVIVLTFSAIVWALIYWWLA